MVNFFGLSFGKKSAKRFTVDYLKNRQNLQGDADAILLKDYLDTDPDLAANVRRFVDNVLIEKPEVIADEDSNVSVSMLKNYNKQLSDVRFYKLMRAALYNLIIYGNAFFEVKFTGRKLREMYVIDADSMRIVKNDADVVVGYEQWIGGAPVVKFQPDEIVHITIDHMDTSEWGHAFLKPLKQALHRKDIAEYYLQWLIENNKLAPVINIKADDMNEEAWAHTISQFNAKNKDPDLYQIINSFKEDNIELLRIFTTEDFDRITKYIEEQKRQIFTLLQIPPIVSGVMDNSNRSNSEIQARLVFYNTLRAFQNLVLEELNFEMIRKLKWKNVKFKFKAMDERVNIDTIKIAKSLRQDLAFTKEAIEEYLKENGFKIPKVEKLFEDDDVDLTGPEERISEKENDDNQNKNSEPPSREPRDKSGLVKSEAQRLEDRNMGVSSDAN